MINPSKSLIKLMVRGQFLSGENMTLKELNIENGNTIMILDD